MKSIILALIYLGTIALGYFTLSLFGILFDSYSNIIHNPNWFVFYLVLFEWWMAIFPASEYYSLHEEYFKKL